MSTIEAQPPPMSPRPPPPTSAASGWLARFDSPAGDDRRIAQSDPGEGMPPGAQEQAVRDHVCPGAYCAPGSGRSAASPCSAPDVYYSSNGPEMFFGYYMILAFPLLVDRALRGLSLAGRRARGPHVRAALDHHAASRGRSSAASWPARSCRCSSISRPCRPAWRSPTCCAASTCVSIVFILLYFFAGSLAFSLVALLLATVSRERHWQMVLSRRAVVVALCFAFCDELRRLLRGAALGRASESTIAGSGSPTASPCSRPTPATSPCSSSAAAAQFTFASDNRSTPLRICMLAAARCS